MASMPFAERFKQLESEGRQLLKSFGNAELTSNAVLSTAWTLGATNLLEVVFRGDNLFCAGFAQADSFSLKLEVLSAAAREFDAGMVEGELRGGYLSIVYTDLANEAQSLLDSGFTRCAAIVSRVALERHLRELGQTRGIPDAQTRKASLVNQDLWKNGAYNQGVWKEIDSWLTVGNEAAHDAQFESKYDKAQVQKTITSIRGFVK